MHKNIPKQSIKIHKIVNSIILKDIIKIRNHLNGTLNLQTY